MNETKVCKGCGRELPLSEFYKDARMIGGHKSYCKECTTEKNRNTPKMSDKDLDEIRKLGLDKIPPRLLILALRHRGYRGKLQLEVVTIEEVVI